MRRSISGFVAALAFGAVAVAQDVPPPEPQEDAIGALLSGEGGAEDDSFADVDWSQWEPEADPTLVDELLISGIRPGPAFWKVADADSVVWVLGVPGAFPKDIAWNQSEMRAHLDGANELIVATGGITVNWLLDPVRIGFNLGRFRGERPLRQVLPEDTRARFEAALSGMDRDAGRFDDLKPGYAAFLLSGAWQRELGMRSGYPEQTVTRAARFRVSQRRVGRSAAIDMLRLIENMSDEQALVCMEDALREIEAGSERAMEAARGWARGDLRVAVSAERGFENCLSAYPEIADEARANIEDATVAILQGLNRPGKAVAIVELRELLAQDGVLARISGLPGIELIAPDVPGLEGEIGAEAYEAWTEE